jgi:hypothetical protein
MKPTVPMVATELANRLRTDIMAELTGFRANDAAMGAQLLDMIAERWDSEAADLVAENRAFRSLVSRAAEELGDAQAAESASGDDEDLRISSLERENDRLRAALIRVHTLAEQVDGDAPRALIDAIWDALRQSVAARRVGSANF